MKHAAGQKSTLNDIGFIFISPIIGLTDSMMAVFRRFGDFDISVIGVDIFGDYEKKTFWKVLSLTALPGSFNRCVSFANVFPEHKVFDKISDAVAQLIRKGKKRIVLGGMSGGFIFAARTVQDPCDEEISGHEVRKFKPYLAGLFGVSPFVFYPYGVHRKDVRLDYIPQEVPTLLLFGSKDDIIPRGTIEYADAASRVYSHIKVRVLKKSELGSKSKEIRHNFFGGKDFIGPLKNIFWHPKAETAALSALEDFLRKLV